MSITSNRTNRLPLLERKTEGNLVCPPLKKALMTSRTVEQFKSKSIRNQDVQLVLKFLRDSFDLGLSITPADIVNKIKLQMSGKEHKIKQMKEQLKDNDVLLFDVQDALDLDPETNPVRTARAFKTFVRTSKEHATRLEKTVKELKEKERSLVGQPDENLLELARSVGVSTIGLQSSGIVTKLKSTFKEMKIDVIGLKDKIKVKHDNIQNLRDREKTKTKRIVELENELEDLKIKNVDLALDLQEAQDKRQSASNRSFDFELKIEQLEKDLEKKACEIESLLQRYEDAGQIVSDLQFEVADKKQKNETLNAQIKLLKEREFKKDDLILNLEKELDDLKQQSTSDSNQHQQINESCEKVPSRDHGKASSKAQVIGMAKGLETDLFTTQFKEVCQLYKLLKKNRETGIQQVYGEQLKGPEKNEQPSQLREERHQLPQLREVNEELSQLREVEVELSQLREDNRRLSQLREVEGELPQLRKDNRRLSQLREVEGELPQLREDNRRLSQLREVEGELPQLREVEGELPQLREDNRRLSQLREVEGELPQLRKDNRRLSQLGEVEGELSQLREDNAKLSQKIKDAQEQIKDLTERLSEQRKSSQLIDDLSAQVQKAQERYQLLQERELKKDDRIFDLEKELSDMKKLVGSDSKHQSEESREKVLYRHQDKASRKAQVIGMTKGFESDLFTTQFKEACQQYKLLKSKRDAGIKQGHDQKVTDPGDNKHLSQLREENHKLSQQLQDAQRQCKDLTERHSEQRKSSQLTDDLSAQVQKAQERYLDLKNRFGSELEDIIKVRQELTESAAKERDDLKAQLSKAKKQTEEANERMLRFQNIGDSLAEENYELSTEISTALKDYQTLQDDFKAAKEENENQVTQLQEENDFVLSQLATLRTKIKDLQESLLKMTEQNKKLNKELSSQADKDTDLFEELEKSLQQCQELEEKADRYKLDFQVNATKWEQEKGELLEQFKEQEAIATASLSTIKQLEEDISLLQKERKEREEKLHTAHNECQKPKKNVLDRQQDKASRKAKVIGMAKGFETDLFTTQLKEACQQYKLLKSKRDVGIRQGHDRKVTDPGDNKHLSQLREENHRLSQQLQDAQRQCKDLKNRIESELEDVIKVRQELTEGAAQERDDFKAQVSKAKKNTEEANERMLRFQNIGDSLAEENYELSTEISTALKDYQTLQDEFKAAKEENENQVTQLQEENDFVLSQLATLRTKIKDLEESLLDMTERNKKLTKDLSSQADKDTDLFEELEKSLQQCQELEEKADRDKLDFQVNATKWEQEKGELLEQFKEQEAIATASLSTIKQLEEDISLLQKERNEREEKLHTARNECQELTDKIHASLERVGKLEELQKGNDEERRKLQSDIKELTDKNQESLEKVKELEKLKNGIDEERKNLQLDVRELIERNQASLEKVKGLEKLKKAVDEKNKILDSDFKDLEEKYRTLEVESEDRIEELQDGIDELLTEVAAARDVCKGLEESLAEVTERNDELLEELATSQEDRDEELLEELEKSFLKCQDLEDKAERDMEAFQRESDRWDKEKRELLEQLEAQKTKPRTDENASSIEELEKQIDELQKERNVIQEKLMTVEKDRKELEDKTTNESLRFKAEETKWEKEEINLLRKLGSQINMNKYLEKRIVELEKERTDLEENLQTIRKQREDMEEKASRETQKLQEEASKLEKDKANILRQLESRQIVCQQFEEYLAASNEESERHLTLATKLKDENDDLSRQLAEANKKIEQASIVNPADILRKVEMSDDQIDELKNRKEELEKKLDKTQNECSILVMKKETLTTRVKQLEGLVKDIQDRNIKLEARIKNGNPRCANSIGQAAVTSLEHKVSQLQKEKNNLEDRIQTTERERKESLEEKEAAVQKIEELEDIKLEIEEKNKKLEFDIKLTKRKVETALAMTDDYKADIDDMRVNNRGLKNQVDFQKKKNEELEELLSGLKEKNKLLESELTDVQTEDVKSKEQLSEMMEKNKLLKKKLSDAQAREVKLDNEVEDMHAMLNKSAAQFGLLTKYGDEITVADLCQSLDDMRKLNAHMKLEINDLEKAKSNLEEMINKGDSTMDSGDSACSGEEKHGKSVVDRERLELKETVADLRYQTYKQEHLIKTIRYQLSEFHHHILKKRDSTFGDMSYVDRAVVMHIYPDVELKTIYATELSFVPLAHVNDEDDEVGKGAFGKVFVRQYKNQLVAVKVPYISERVKEEDDEKRSMRLKADHARTTMEALVHLALAEHPSYPKTIGTVDYNGAPSLVVEFLGDKDTGSVFSLSQAIKYPDETLNKGDWFNIITDIVSGIKAMHVKGLLHNDLKANNVLLQWDHSDKRWHAFIIDMGKVSTQAIPLKHRHMKEEDKVAYKDGSIYQHLAPEYMLDQQPMSIQTDIYSVGKIIGRIESKVMKSKALRELVAEMTNLKPRLRPSWKHIEKAISKAQRRAVS